MTKDELMKILSNYQIMSRREAFPKDKTDELVEKLLITIYPITREDIVGILETLTVTDEWGGSKLATWQYGHAVMVDGIDYAADEIMAKLKGEKNDTENY